MQSWSAKKELPAPQVGLDDGTLAEHSADANSLLDSLLESSIIHPEEWNTLSRESLDRLRRIYLRQELLKELVALRLINNYQSDRIQANTRRGLVLGNYRVLDRIGSGGIGIVFEAEHILMRRRVAIKVVPIDSDEQADLLTRFLREMRSVAQMDHPNIVSAFDAGVTPREVPTESDLYYFVMERLSGQDLELLVEAEPLSIARACSIIYQAASALDKAHSHLLVHRDIKPSNIFVTSEGVAKLLDFGLVRHLPTAALTTPDLIVGTLDYMAPEQTVDPTAVDIRSDIFSLGATLFFALTGQSPFPAKGTLFDAIETRRTQQPLIARSFRTDIPEALEEVMMRMMAIRPEDRFEHPQAVMHALMPFVSNSTQFGQFRARETPVPNAIRATRRLNQSISFPRVLVADHDVDSRRNLARLLASNGFDVAEAADAEAALRLLRDGPIEAVYFAIDMPKIDGRTVLKALRDNPPRPHLKIIMTTSRFSADEMSQLLSAGADDYLCFPASSVQIVARARSAVKHKHAQDRTDILNRQLLDLNVELERSVNAKSSDLVQTRNALVLGLARLVEYRSTETIAHLSRMQRYCMTLSREAATLPTFADAIDQRFIDSIECCAPLHDIGNVGLPDHVLLKAGKLDEGERIAMQQHTVIGARTLQYVARKFGARLEFLRMAIDIARHHHEHYDGSGYPDGLAGAQIPLAARVVSIADAYDALRSRRMQRPGLSHANSLRIILDSSPGKYDPVLLGAFTMCAEQFERIFRDIPDSLILD